MVKDSRSYNAGIHAEQELLKSEELSECTTRSTLHLSGTSYMMFCFTS